MDTNLVVQPYLMRMESGDANIKSLDKPQITMNDRLKMYNKEYIALIKSGYVNLIDSIIEDVNNSEAKYDDTTKNKILLLMISLVLDSEDVKAIKKNSKVKSVTTIIPNITELEYLNDIPFDQDIVERVYRYLYRLVKDKFVLPDTPGGNICATGVVFDNQKDFEEVFQTYVIENDKIRELKNSELTQDISEFTKKNKLIRQKMIEFVSRSGEVTKEKEIEIRRKYKFDPQSQSFQKRKNPISKKVFDLLAEKNLVVYKSLYVNI